MGVTAADKDVLDAPRRDALADSAHHRGGWPAPQALALLGLVDAAPEAPPQDFEVLRLEDVIDREHPGDAFVREWQSFDPLKAGELIGHRHDGSEVRAEQDGFIVFPNPRALPGNEWFYFARRSARRLL